MLPKGKELKERILSAFDRQYYDALYTQMSYAFGQKWGATPAYVEGSAAYEDLPIYPDIKTDFLPIGQSRRILNATLRTLSRVLSQAPVPKFPQVDEVTEEVRRQFWLANANGNRGIPTKWLKQMQHAFTEGDSLGVGAVKHGLRTHPRTGLQVTEMKQVPILQCYWDPFESDPRNSKWVAVASFLPYETAVSRFGEKKVKDHKREWTVTSEGRNAEFVRIIEYWDVGYAGNSPAYAMFIGNLDKGEVSDNEFGIPVSFCVNYVAPGMKRPIGRAVMQMSTQELINDIEKYMRQTMKRGPSVDVYDAGAFDPASLARWKQGDTSRGLEVTEGFTDDVRKIFQRQAGMEVPQGVLALFGIAERQYNDDSNQTEQTRGNALGSRTTAHEVQNLQARAQESAGLTDQSAVEFLQDTVKDSFDVSVIGDTHPVPLDIFGRNILFNDPQDPQSFISVWGEEESNILIDIESTTVSHDAMKKQQKQQELMMLQPLVGVTIDPGQYTDELLETMSVKDKEKWKMQQPISQPTPADGQQ